MKVAISSSPFSRRHMMRASVAAAVAAFAHSPLSAFGFADPEEGATLIPFLDAQPVDPKRPMLQWDRLRDWITPNDQVFAVNHYGTPEVDASRWRLEISGLVREPRTLTLDQVRARPRQEVIATLECSGNSARPAFLGAVGNIRWTGTPLAPLLKECGPQRRAIEVVFFAADEKTETIRDKDYLQNFARSLALGDALQDEVILAYEMNGEPLSKDHGAPLRLIVPGWFGIAWVKWLTRIEVLDRRYMNKFMARDYVTIRGEEKNGRTVWRETSVGPIDVKSIVARAERLRDGAVRLHGAAWTDGTPLKAVEVRIDGGRWTGARLDRKPDAPYAWTFWSFDWTDPRPGAHTVVARAIDEDERVQPPADDPAIRLKRTYWEANQQYPRTIKV
jgi:DMSO/TMAO reductase YedYZ molybdopterin-dependent catalytic subunit